MQVRMISVVEGKYIHVADLIKFLSQEKESWEKTKNRLGIHDYSLRLAAQAHIDEIEDIVKVLLNIA